MSTLTPPKNMITYLWIMLFLMIPFVFHSAIYEGALLPKLALFQIVLLIIFLFSVRYISISTPPKFFVMGITFYALLHVLSLSQAINPIEATLQLAQHIGFFTLPILVTTTLSTDQLHRVINLAPWAGLPIALLGIGQYLGWELVHIPSNAHPSATFFHRNAAAAYIICILPLAWIGFQCARTHAKTLAQAGLLFLLGVFLICTRTRAAWVGLLGASICIYIVSFYLPSKNDIPLKKLKHRLVCIICIVIGLATWLPENIQGAHRVHFDEKKSDVVTTVESIFTEGGHRGRLDLWQHTRSMIAQNPLGVGLGNWQFQYPHYARGNHINVKAAPERPHNDLLWIAAELGLIGLFAFFYILVFTIRIGLPILAQASLEKRTTIQGLFVLLGAYLIDGLFGFPRGQIVPTLFFWFALGGIIQLANKQTSLVQHTHAGIKIVTSIVILFCLIITIKRIQYDIHHQQVHSAERNANWQTVITESEKALQIGTYRANTFIARGRAYYRTGNLKAAETAYKIGLSLHPNSLNAYNNLGIVYRQLGKNEQAEQAFLKALYLFPNFSEASYNLGNVYTNMSRWDDAVMAYQKAQKMGVNIPQLYFKLGQVSYAKGNIKQAEQYFLDALQRDANFKPALQALEQMKISP